MAVENANPLFFQGLEWLGDKVSYGLGWFLASTMDVKVAFHPGLIDGYSSALVMIPEKKLGFVVLTNVNLSAAPGLLIQDLLGRILDQNAALIEPAEPDPRAASDGSLTGKYENAAYGPVAIELSGDRLILEYKGNAWPLTRRGESAADFSVSAFGLQIPLSVQFVFESGSATQLSIPFSLDPRVGPQVFIRA
jgi:hypothetical protein